MRGSGRTNERTRAVIRGGALGCLAALWLASGVGAAGEVPGIESARIPQLAQDGPSGKRREVEQKLEEERREKAEKARQRREAAERKKAEAARKRRAAEKRKKDEAARKRRQAEAERRKAEEARKRREEAARRAAEESRKRQGTEEARKRRAAEEARKRRAAEEARKRRAAEEARKRREAAARRKAEEARRRRAAAWRPGRVFKDCPECPEMVVIPAGSFTMGSPPGESGRNKSEGPRHPVRVKSFAIGKYEVTFAQWDACVAAGGCNGYRPIDKGWGRGRRPVMNVSWKDALAYVAWLSRKTSQHYRLPSEAEWEYAARAGTATPFYFGARIGANQVNYDGNFAYGRGRESDYRGKTVPVGSFPSNGFGLHDVHGNVWEWVEDCWNGSYRGAPSDGSAWASGNCRKRVLRGGSWVDIPGYVRSASRLRYGTGTRSDLFGFRVARTFGP